MGKGCSGLRARSRLNILGLELSWGPVRPRLVPPVTDKSGNCNFKRQISTRFLLNGGQGKCNQSVYAVAVVLQQ